MRIQTNDARSGRSRAGSLQRVPLIETAALLVLTVMLVVAACSTDARPSSTQTQAAYVKQGDTLWTLAERHPAAGASTAQTAELLARLNGIEGSMLEAGTTILVPARAELASAQAMR